MTIPQQPRGERDQFSDYRRRRKDSTPLMREKQSEKQIENRDMPDETTKSLLGSSFAWTADRVRGVIRPSAAGIPPLKFEVFQKTVSQKMASSLHRTMPHAGTDWADGCERTPPPPPRSSSLSPPHPPTGFGSAAQKTANEDF